VGNAHALSTYPQPFSRRAHRGLNNKAKNAVLWRKRKTRSVVLDWQIAYHIGHVAVTYYQRAD